MAISSTDLLKLTAVCGAFVLLALLWVYRFKQEDVSWSFQTIVSVTSRVLVVEAIVLAVFIYGCEFTVNQFLISMPIVVIGLLFSNRNAQYIIPPADGVIFAAIVAALLVTCILPFYFIKQFVIGFPDGIRFRDSFENSLPQPHTPTISVADTEISSGTTGIVSAALRPLGQVKIDGQTYEARHVANSFVDVGVEIIVTAQKNRTLLIKEAETIASNEESQT